MQDKEQIRIADSLMYEGEDIPVTKVELEQFVYAFSTETYTYPGYNIMADSISLHIGKNVTEILLGNTISQIQAYTVENGNTKYSAANGVLYRLDEQGQAALLNIPDRYAGKTIAFPDNCDAIENEALESTYKYDTLYPVEYSMGYLASEYLKKNYIHQRTFYWDPAITLEKYLTRDGSLYIPIEIEDPDYGETSVLVIYGDGENHKMYDEITTNQDVFLKNAFSRKGYSPSGIKIDKISYKDITSYDIMEQYDFIYIKDDTYDYFGETQYQIIYDASFNKIYITYAKNLEELPYADKEENITYNTVEKIQLPDSLEPDGVSMLLMYQKELFPSLTAMQGNGEGAIYQMSEEDVIYAEDEEAVYYIGVTTNNTHKQYHLDTEKAMHIMPCAFKNAGSADIYIHAPQLYLYHDCFQDYSLAEEDGESKQKIHVTYDKTVYQSYEYEGEQAEFPTVGTEDEVYEYWAVYELTEADTTEEASTEVPSTESAGGTEWATESEGSTESGNTESADTEQEDTPVRAVEAIPLSGGSMSMKPIYYLNAGNIEQVGRYNSRGKKTGVHTTDTIVFGLDDECNADYLLKKITTLKNKKGKLFLVTANSKYNKKKGNEYQFVETGMDMETLTRAVSLMNCKYFQYLRLVQSFYDGGMDIYMEKEEDLHVFHEWDYKNSKYRMKNIRFGLKTSDWEIMENDVIFAGEAYGIDLDKFEEYYNICSKIDNALDRIIGLYRMKSAKSPKEVLDKINNYVRSSMSYDRQYEIAGLSWALKETGMDRNQNTDPKRKDEKYHSTHYHGMCGAYSRLAFALAAKCGIDAIPCAAYKDKNSVKNGATHSITKVVLNNNTYYCDFCWSSGDYNNKTESDKYMYMTEQSMQKYENHYNPVPDNMGEKITIKNSMKESSEVKVTFDGNGGSINFNAIMTHGGKKIMDFPDVERKGYVLKGWYTKKNGGNKVIIGQKLSGATKLYAHWEKISIKKGKIVRGKFTKKRSFDIEYEKLTNVDGYQVQCSTLKNFTGSGTKSAFIRGNQNNHYVFKDLSLGRNYYFRIRAYRRDSTGAIIYGKWSVVKKIKAE